jgi:predicted metal-dependent hydrolase
VIVVKLIAADRRRLPVKGFCGALLYYKDTKNMIHNVLLFNYFNKINCFNCELFFVSLSIKIRIHQKEKIMKKQTAYQQQAKALVARRVANACTAARQYLGEHEALLQGWNLTEAVRGRDDLKDLLGTASSSAYMVGHRLRMLKENQRLRPTTWAGLRARLYYVRILENETALLCMECGWLGEYRADFDARQPKWREWWELEMVVNGDGGWMMEAA